MGIDSKILSSQVGGHPGVSTTEDGSLLIKPALPHEISFYEHLTSDHVFAHLRPYVPKFYGTLKFQGTVENGNLETFREAPKEEKDKCFSLEYPYGVDSCIYSTHTFDSAGESVS